MKIDGKQIASEILEDLKSQVLKLKEKGVIPTLAIILIGDDQASESYIKQKELKAGEIGAEIKLFRFKETNRKDLLKLIKNLNIDPKIHGIIVQRPLPEEFDRNLISEAINPLKDVDGFNPDSEFDAPVAEAVVKILQIIGESDLVQKQIVIIGKGETAGGPIIKFLRETGCRPEIIDKKTPNPENAIKEADIIISAVGHEKIFDTNLLKNNQILIGVGLYMGDDGKLHGDYPDEEVEGKVKYFTPRIGGVGPVNVAYLMKNLLEAAS